MRPIRSTRRSTRARSGALPCSPIAVGLAAAKAGGIAGWNTAWAVPGMATAAAASGSEAIASRAACATAKPPESGGFLREAPPGGAGKKSARFAGHRGVALLNDRPCKGFPERRFFGRIAQLVEQLTLNQRVPGSSPGAPTKLFNNLADY